MRELSLFTGTGGGLLGSHLLGWTPIGYVEFNEYCQRVIRQRINDEILPSAPIFGDVREFVQSGTAREYRGFADVVTGGFPCQPFSVAGKQLGSDDPRNMWPATIAVIDAVRPRYCFLENVPGLLNSGYFGTIIGDLAKSGYCVRYRILSAAELGAPHKRDRLWIMAHADSRGEPKLSAQVKYGKNSLRPTPSKSDGTCGPGNSGRDGGLNLRTAVKQLPTPTARDWRSGTGTKKRDGHAPGLPEVVQGQLSPDWVEWLMGWPVGWTSLEPLTDIDGWVDETHTGEWWQHEHDLPRVDKGIPNRTHRLKAIGNGQVPVVAAMAWLLLTIDLRNE